jgi:hypothetical protein
MINANLTATDVINMLRNGNSMALVNKLSAEILQLKASLSSIDYKTIKNTQYEKLGRDLPYSWEELFAESENYRIQIRQKEAEIEALLQSNTSTTNTAEQD